MTPQEIGQLLQKTRETKGLSIAQIQAELKIRVQYLSALESGEFTDIPGEVYLKGFIRSYAGLLGLDGTALIAQIMPEAQTEKSPPKAPLPPERRSQSSLGKPLETSRKMPISPWLPALALLVVAVIAYYIPRFFQASPPPPVVKTIVHHTKPKATAPQQQIALVSNQQVTDQSGQTIYQIVYRVSHGPITLKATVSAACWINAVGDGQDLTPAGGILVSGGDQNWTAQKILTARFGYAPGIHLWLDGKDLGPASTDTVNTVSNFTFQVGKG